MLITKPLWVGHFVCASPLFGQVTKGIFPVRASEQTSLYLHRMSIGLEMSYNVMRQVTSYDEMSHYLNIETMGGSSKK